ncbi:MAG: ROK family protein [Phycisphaerae bacterium]
MALRYYLGIDLGGTNIKTGVVDENSKVHSKVSIPTGVVGGPDEVIPRIFEAGRQAIVQAGLTIGDICAIGIGAPGPLHHKKGIIIALPNLSGWENFPIREKISSHFHIPATLENDANVAAWGEYWAGAGKGKHSLVMFTLGTGIGGGIVYHGRFIRGFYDTAAELGHITVEPNGRKCNCGQRGCVEAYASAANTAKIAVEGLQAGAKSSMKAIYDRGEPINTEIILDHMLKGDQYARDLWHQTCRYLAIACEDMNHVINPELIVLAGGMVGAGDHLLLPVQKYYEELQGYVFHGNSSQIVLAKLGGDAGLVGAAGAAKLNEELGEL